MIKLARICVVFAAASLVTIRLHAQEVPLPDLIEKHGCLLCHTVDTKVLGPSYKDVAKKYKGDKDAPARLAERIRKGSTGIWGTVPMPPNDIKEADALRLANWVLSL